MAQVFSNNPQGLYGRFGTKDPALIAKQIMSRVVDVATKVKVSRIEEIARDEGNKAMADFFPTVANRFMGTQAVPAALDVNWPPLTERYTAYKGNRQFWTFSRLFRRRKARKQTRAGRSDVRLIQYVRKLSAERIFGGFNVTVGQRRGVGDTANTIVFFTNRGGGFSIPISLGFSKNLPGFSYAELLTFKGSMDMIVALKNSGALQASGNRGQAYKLLGKTAYHRPLLAPALVYFLERKVKPRIARALEKEGFKTKVNEQRVSRSGSSAQTSKQVNRQVKKAAVTRKNSRQKLIEQIRRDHAGLLARYNSSRGRRK